MKVIIAGGRDFTGFAKVVDAVERSGFNIVEVVSGGACGADKLGENYATSRNLDLTVMYANWGKYGKAAGPRRNAKMAFYADALIAMPGGAGTANMVGTMRAAGKLVYEYKEGSK